VTCAALKGIGLRVASSDPIERSSCSRTPLGTLTTLFTRTEHRKYVAIRGEGAPNVGEIYKFPNKLSSRRDSLGHSQALNQNAVRG
jgi:hypothetical protein